MVVIRRGLAKDLFLHLSLLGAKERARPFLAHDPDGLAALTSFVDGHIFDVSTKDGVRVAIILAPVED